MMQGLGRPDWHGTGPGGWCSGTWHQKRYGRHPSIWLLYRIAFAMLLGLTSSRIDFVATEKREGCQCKKNENCDEYALLCGDIHPLTTFYSLPLYLEEARRFRY